MTDFIDKTFGSTGTSDTIRAKGDLLLAVAGTFDATIVLQMQVDSDLERTLVDADWVDIATITNSSDEMAKNVSSPRLRRWRVKCSVYASGSPRVTFG